MSSRTSLLAIVTGIVVSSSAWSPGASVAAEAVEVRAGGLQPVDGTWLPNPVPFYQDMTRYVINDSVLESGLTPGASLVMGVEGNPLPDNPNNEDGYYCDSYDHENCTNRGFTFFSILPPCEQDLTWNCIRHIRPTGHTSAWANSVGYRQYGSPPGQALSRRSGAGPTSGRNGKPVERSRDCRSRAGVILRRQRDDEGLDDHREVPSRPARVPCFGDTGGCVASPAAICSCTGVSEGSERSRGCRRHGGRRARCSWSPVPIQRYGALLRPG